MQHYVGLRPMFDLEVMNADANLVLGDPGSLPNPSNVARGLTTLYKEITGLNDSMCFMKGVVSKCSVDFVWLPGRYCPERSSNNKSSFSFTK